MKSKMAISQIEIFDSLPGGALVGVAVILAVAGMSRSTLSRWRGSGLFPEPEELEGVATLRWRVSKVRKAIGLEQLESISGCSCSSFNNLKLLQQPLSKDDVANEGAKIDEALVFPPSFIDEEVVVANRALFGFVHLQKQQLLDEVEGNIRAKSIRKSGLTLLLHLVKLAKKDAFVPSVGLSVQKDRDAKNLLFKAAEPAPKPLRDPSKLEQRRNEMRQALARKPRKPRK